MRAVQNEATNHLYQTTNKRDLFSNCFANVKSSYRSNKPQRFLAEVKNTLWCNSEVRIPYNPFQSHSPIKTCAFSSTEPLTDAMSGFVDLSRGGQQDSNYRRHIQHWSTSILIDLFSFALHARMQRGLRGSGHPPVKFIFL